MLIDGATCSLPPEEAGAARAAFARVDAAVAASGASDGARLLRLALPDLTTALTALHEHVLTCMFQANVSD